MGYVYQGGRLCCDICGNPPATKVKCPHNWCQPVAVCANCKQEYSDISSVVHRDCAEASANWKLRKHRKQALLDRGEYVRTSAISNGDLVKVTFWNKEGREMEFLMEPDTYRSIPLLEPATPADFAKKGLIATFKEGD